MPKRRHHEQEQQASVFAALQSIEEEDVAAARQRRKTTESEKVHSRAALSQTKVFQSLVECRILLQRSLQSNVAEEDECNELLVELLQARYQSNRPAEESTDSVDYAEVLNDPERLEAVLQSEYRTQREDWKEVLDRRHKSIRLQRGGASGIGTKFLGQSSIDASFWQQVESVGQHELLRRQQMPSTDREFDDTKVYQQMLKDFVSSHAASDDKMAQVAQARLRQKSKSKKNEVDRRASKGRKIRYTPISKLENFTFPQGRNSTTMLLEPDEWFRSLFGGVGSRTVES